MLDMSSVVNTVENLTNAHSNRASKGIGLAVSVAPRLLRGEFSRAAMDGASSFVPFGNTISTAAQQVYDGKIDTKVLGDVQREDTGGFVGGMVGGAAGAKIGAVALTPLGMPAVGAFVGGLAGGYYGSVYGVEAINAFEREMGNAFTAAKLTPEQEAFYKMYDTLPEGGRQPGMPPAVAALADMKHQMLETEQSLTRNPRPLIGMLTPEGSQAASTHVELQSMLKEQQTAFAGTYARMSQDDVRSVNDYMQSQSPHAPAAASPMAAMPVQQARGVGGPA
jgi:hypothetical protein